MTDKIEEKKYSYRDTRIAIENGWNISDIDTYTGIDRIGLLVPERDFHIDFSGNCLLKKGHRFNQIAHTGNSNGIFIKRMPSIFAALNYTLSFSLSRILNGINLSSSTPVDYDRLTSEINERLAGGGLCVTDWDRVQLCMLEVNRNLILEDDYEDYRSLLSVFKYPRTKRRLFKNSIYFQTPRNTIKTIIYNKGDEIKKKMRQSPLKTILRFEIRYTKTKLLSEQFSKFAPIYNYLWDRKPYFKLLSGFDVDAFFRDKARQFLKPLDKFENFPMPLSLEAGLEAYYSNKRYPKKSVRVALDILKAYRSGLMTQYLNQNSEKIIKPSERAEASITRTREIQRKAEEILQTVIIMEEITKHGFRRIDELRRGLIEERPNLNRAANPNRAA
ncbi:phage/plasmid replication domain-containing protein [Leptospira santarosai]|uniref:phage/plasmid replication domain-containing protein n=1 Tax=Leptospira santarosai TaxID=28183 RepID=UPI0007738CF9|nr:phage/plasmid replication protein [Leptospira santarosai]